MSNTVAEMVENHLREALDAGNQKDERANDLQELHAFYKKMEQANLEQAKQGGEVNRLICSARATVWHLAAEKLAKMFTLDEPTYEQALCIGALQ